jgi:hypothetical protein
VELLTNGVILPREGPTSTTILRRPISTPQDETDEKNSEVVEASKLLQWEWKLGPVTSVPIQKPPQKIEPLGTPPACVHSFVRAVAIIPEVKCVVVEDGEGHTVHITTFVEGLTEEKRREIYAVEAETIYANPNLVFDFHVRVAEEVSGNLASISGKHYYAIWGELDAQRS